MKPFLYKIKVIITNRLTDTVCHCLDSLVTSFADIIYNRPHTSSLADCVPFQIVFFEWVWFLWHVMHTYLRTLTLTKQLFSVISEFLRLYFFFWFFYLYLCIPSQFTWFGHLLSLVIFWDMEIIHFLENKWCVLNVNNIIKIFTLLFVCVSFDFMTTRTIAPYLVDIFFDKNSYANDSINKMFKYIL